MAIAPPWPTGLGRMSEGPRPAMARAHGVFSEMPPRNRALGDGGAGLVHGPWKRLHMRWLAAAGSRRHLSLSRLSFAPAIRVSRAAFLHPAAPLPPPLTCRGGCLFLLLPLTPMGGQAGCNRRPTMSTLRGPGRKSSDEPRRRGQIPEKGVSAHFTCRKMMHVGTH